MGTGAETGSGIGSVGGPPGAVVGAVVGAVSVGGVLLYNNREAVGDALDKGMTSFGEAEILKAESEMAFWNDPCGAFASVFKNDDSQKGQKGQNGFGNSDEKGQEKKDRPQKIPKPGVSGKEGAKNVPSWAKGERPYVDENGKDFAKRLLDKKYGKGNYKDGADTEYNKIRIWGDRSFMNP
ncbi:hypothetical protein [Salmonella enterica]|nr:Uncharacterised protein [Salmonella enterica subsp. salamae]